MLIVERLKDIPEKETEPLNDRATNSSERNDKKSSQGQHIQATRSTWRKMSWRENGNIVRMDPINCQVVGLAAEWQGCNELRRWNKYT